MSATIGNRAKTAWRGRIEDPALLEGHAQFTDDLRFAGAAFGVFVRSPHASARIRSIDAVSALHMPGVLAILTSADMAAAGVGNVGLARPFPGRDGSKLVVPHRPALAGDRVRHVGEPVALAVAESLMEALDAAEAVEVDYEALPAIVDLREALASSAPQLWPEAPGNLAIDWSIGVAGGTSRTDEIARIFASAPHVARVAVENQRVIVASLEARGAVAVHDEATGAFTLHCGSQGASILRDQLAASMGLAAEKLRLVTHDVGGGFGMKSSAYPEYAALLVAARKLRRPVRWTSTRSEAFVSDNQARDTYTEAELALGRDGRFLALRVNAVANMGTYLSAVSAFIATFNFARCFPTVYRIPQVDVGVRCVFTNTLPVGPYRGAGRPEANYAMERLVEEAARVTGIDRIALRRRNLIAHSMMPYRTPVGTVYDSGEFEAVLDQALRRADYAGFAARRRSSEAAGRRRGIGVSCFLEHAGGQPQEPAEIAFPGDGTVRVGVTVQGIGQGIATVLRRLAAERLGIPEEKTVLWQGDTRLGLTGLGTVASRSAMTAGTAVHRAVERVIEKGHRIASLVLEAAERDIEYAGGAFSVAGTDRTVSLFEVAAQAAAMRGRGEPAETLDTRETVEIEQSYPNGCHVAEIELDPETGAVSVVAYTAVDDCGVALDSVLVEGQVQGGVAQGIGQAILENAFYDRTSGQLVSGSFMDYAMPRADSIPPLDGALHAVPCRTNPLGVKGVGEAGTTGALAAVMNAILDALPAGAALEMPATPEKIWRACRDAARKT
jgi:aerobic carbon-monoxide dehydrogenase large subunit